MHAFAAFTEKHLRPYRCCDTKFTTTDNCTHPKTESQIEIIETEFIGMQILLWNKKNITLFLANFFVRS